MKYIILTAAFALASCASNGGYSKRSCSKGACKTERAAKKDCKTGCKTKKPDCSSKGCKTDVVKKENCKKTGCKTKK